MALDRQYLESLSLRDLRGLLDGAHVRMRRGDWVVGLDRAEASKPPNGGDPVSVVHSVFGTGRNVLDALTDALVQASEQGWFE